MEDNNAKKIAIMENVVRELDKFRDLLEEGSMKDFGESKEEIDYTEVLREFLDSYSLSSMIKEIESVVSLARSTNEEVERKFKENGYTTREALFKLILSQEMGK